MLGEGKSNHRKLGTRRLKNENSSPNSVDGHEHPQRREPVKLVELGTIWKVKTSSHLKKGDLYYRKPKGGIGFDTCVGSSTRSQPDEPHSSKGPPAGRGSVRNNYNEPQDLLALKRGRGGGRIAISLKKNKGPRPTGEKRNGSPTPEGF